MFLLDRLINRFDSNDYFQRNDKYQCRRGGVIQTLWTTILIIFIIIVIVEDLENDRKIAIIGPNDETYFINIKIDTWFKWFTIMLCITISQYIQINIHQSLGTYRLVQVWNTAITNLNRSSREVLFLTDGYMVFSSCVEIIEFFVIVTKRLDFIFAILAVTIITNHYMTKEVIRGRCKEKESSITFAESVELTGLSD